MGSGTSASTSTGSGGSAVVPGPGPLATLSIASAPGATTEFAALRKNGFAVSESDVRLQGTLAPDFEGDLVLTHEAMEQAILQERVRATKGGRFDVKVHLLRGRNVFVFASGTDPSMAFRLDLFHRSTLREWVESIVKALVLVLVVKTFVVQAFFIPTQSMESTLLVGDYLLVDKISYLFREPRPGEIIVFEFPKDPSKDFIKRCVAVGGDRIAHDDNRLIHNGRPLKEPYAQYLETRTLDAFEHRSFPERTIAHGTYWVMGDNRNNSQDSRYWGALPAWRLIGKAFTSYWPLGRVGFISHVFGAPDPGR
jgi:signal peptidase I